MKPWYAQFPQEETPYGRRSHLTEIVMEVKEMIVGSTEMNRKDFLEDIEILKYAIENWQESNFDIEYDFDSYLKDLIETAIRMSEKYISENKL